jgi:repressor of nif and glnA expression
MDMNTIDEPSVPREILVNITVITDQSWDNVAKIMRRIDDKCIKTSHRIYVLEKGLQFLEDLRQTKLTIPILKMF